MHMSKNIVRGNGLQDELEFFLTEVGALANRLRAATRTIHAGDRLPVGGKMVLQTLAQAGSQTVPQLARGRGSSRQNIQVLVNRLESDGLVEFVDNPAHRSSALIQLTSSGEKLLGSVLKRDAVFLAGLLQHTGEKEVLAAGELLARLRQLLEGRTAATPRTASKLPPEKVRPKRRAPKAEARPPTRVIAAAPPPPAEPVEDGLPVHLL